MTAEGFRIMLWITVALLVGYGFGKYGFAWIGETYRWAVYKFAK